VGGARVIGRIRVAGDPGAPNGDLQLTAVRSVLAGVELDAPVPALAMTDCVVDGPVTGASVHAAFEGCTVFGAVAVRSLDAGSCVFDATVTAEYRQVGCLRFSFTGPRSQTPRRFRCVPADGGEAAAAPVYASRDPGTPSYAALAASCPAAIRTGGEDGAEMGVHHHLRRPLRVEAMARALAPYVPVRLELGIFGG